MLFSGSTLESISRDKHLRSVSDLQSGTERFYPPPEGAGMQGCSVPLLFSAGRKSLRTQQMHLYCDPLTYNTHCLLIQTGKEEYHVF